MTTISKLAKHRLLMLEDKEGRLTRQGVLDDARDEDSPLHPCFEWDDGIAAEKYRLDQAGQIIRSVELKITTTKFTYMAPMYARDADMPTNVPGYRNISMLRGDEDRARDTVIAELSAVGDRLARAKAIAIALDLSDEIDDLLAHVLSVRHVFEEPPSRPGGDGAPLAA